MSSETSTTSPRVLDARCGRCGYNVTGLDSLTCPECGGDLRHVGIVNADEQRKLGRGLLFGASIVYTGVLALVGGLLAFTVEQSLPVERTYSNTMTLKSYAVQGREYLLDASIRAWQEDLPLMQVTMTLHPGQWMATQSLRYFPDTNRCSVADPAGTYSATKQPFTLEALLVFLRGAGVDDRADPTAIDEAKIVYEQIRAQSRIPRMMNSPGRTTGGLTSNNKPLAVNASTVASADTPRFATPMIVLLLIAAWLAGLRAMWRYSRPRRGGAAIDRS